MAITDYSQTAASNTELNGLNVTGHSIPAGADDLVRQIMADLADLVNGGLTIADLGVVSTVDINGGTADDVVIGGDTPSAGSFTTVTTSGALDVGDTSIVHGSFTLDTVDELGANATNYYNVVANRTGANASLGGVRGYWGPSLGGGNMVTAIYMLSGADTTNKDEGYIELWTASPGGAMAERLRVDSDGVKSASFVKTAVTTVASLPSASTAGAGARHFVTDATSTTFASTVAGGGSNSVPVYSDGTNWKIG